MLKFLAGFSEELRRMVANTIRLIEVAFILATLKFAADASGIFGVEFVFYLFLALLSLAIISEAALTSMGIAKGNSLPHASFRYFVFVLILAVCATSGYGSFLALNEIARIVGI